MVWISPSLKFVKRIESEPIGTGLPSSRVPVMTVERVMHAGGTP